MSNFATALKSEIIRLARKEDSKRTRRIEKGVGPIPQ